MLNLGDEFPNFKGISTIGDIDFHQWLGGSWAILLAHPADFTPVCTTELGCLAQLVEEFTEKGVKLIALSCDELNTHREWIDDILHYSKMEGKTFPYPIISDKSREIAVKLGMIDPDEKDKDGLPLTCRAVFIIGPDRRLKLAMLYPATTGRNFREILRCVDSLKLTAEKRVATPVDWKPGQDVIVQPTVDESELKALFPEGVVHHPLPSGKNYYRTTPHTQ